MARFGDGDPLSGTRQGDGSYVQDVNVVGGGSSGGAVTIADGADVAEGATTAAAYTDQTGAASGTVVGLLKGLYTAVKGIVTSGGTYTTTLPTLTNGQRSTLQLDGNGRLIVKIADSRFARSGFANGYNQFSSFNLFADDGGSGPLNVAVTYQDPATGNGFTARGDTSGLFLGATQFWTESSTGLAASATLNGTLRVNGGTAGGVGSRFSFFVAEAFSDVAGGTLFIDKTVDGGTTYRQVGSIALVANTSVSLKVPLSAAGYRTRVVNGATPQGAALVTSAFSLN